MFYIFPQSIQLNIVIKSYDFRNAFSHSEFQEAMKEYPSSAVASPHLFSKVAVENLCVGS